MPGITLVRSIVPVRAMLMVLAVLVVLGAVVIAYAAAHGVPVHHVIGMTYDNKPRMTYG